MLYYPEGTNPALRRRFGSIKELKEAVASRRVFEARVLRCDSRRNLTVDLGCCEGIVPRREGAAGIDEGTVRDIALISRVNKYICFRVAGFHRSGDRLLPVLSRRAVQLACRREYLASLRQGDVIDACVTRCEGFGAFIDVGAGIHSLIPIDMLSVSRIAHPADRVYEGERIRTVLRKREPDKLTFSLRELLGTWEENAARFSQGETVTGIVRGVESYGVFVELAPNLTGLAEYDSRLVSGQQVSVYIKSVLPEKMKIKLAVIEAFPPARRPAPLTYYTEATHLDRWEYSPVGAQKHIYTLF